MKTLGKLFLFTLVLVGALGGLGYLAVVNIDAVVARYREPIERWVSDRLGGQVGASAIGVKLLPRPRLDLEGVALRFDGAEPALTATRVGIDFELAPLLWRSLRLNSVTLEEPIVRLERNSEGTRLRGAPLPSTDVSGGPGFFVGLDRFEVRRGKISLVDTGAGTTELIEGIELAGGLRFEEGELRISPLSVRGVRMPRFGDFRGEFEEVRSSLKNDRGSAVLREGSVGKIRFSGEGEWRIAEGSARVRLQGEKTDLTEIFPLVDSIVGRSIVTELEDVKLAGAIEPKFTIEVGRGGIYRVNGALGLEAGSFNYRDLVVGEIRGVAQIALTEGEGKIALESFRGVAGASRAAVSLEGAIDLSPFGGELRLVTTALPVSELKRFLPESERNGLAITNGAVDGKVTYRLGAVPQWSLLADLREGAGTVRGVPFQDGVGKIRVLGGGSNPEVSLDQLTVGLAGGTEAIALKGELRGGRGSGSLSASKLGVSTAVALLGVETPGWTELTGDLRLDLKGRYDGNSFTVQGPIAIAGGAGRFGDYQLGGVRGEFELQSGGEQKLVAREVHLELNGEPLLWRGNVVGAERGIRIERCALSGLGGDLAIDGTVSFEEPRRVELTGRGRGIALDSVRKLLGVESEGSALTGELSDVRWRLTGSMGDNFARSLEGGVAFRLERGALRGVNIGRIAVEKIASIPLLRNLLVGAIPGEYRPYFDASDTPIHSLRGEIDLVGGRASTETLRLESDLFGLEGRGGYEFGGGVDLGATLWLERRFAYSLADRVRELRGLFGSEGTIVMPLRITGAPNELSVSPDIGALVARAAQGVIEREAERFIDRAFDRLSGDDSFGDESSDDDSSADDSSDEISSDDDSVDER